MPERGTLQFCERQAGGDTEGWRSVEAIEGSRGPIQFEIRKAQLLAGSVGGPAGDAGMSASFAQDVPAFCIVGTDRLLLKLSHGISYATMWVSTIRSGNCAFVLMIATCRIRVLLGHTPRQRLVEVLFHERPAMLFVVAGNSRVLFRCGLTSVDYRQVSSSALTIYS